MAPAVVSVNVVRREHRITRDPFDFFFMPREFERLVEGIGSGFLISTDGVVITNQHATESPRVRAGTTTAACSGKTQINRFRVETAEDMQRAFRAAQGAGAITVWFERRGAVGRTSFYVR